MSLMQRAAPDPADPDRGGDHAEPERRHPPELRPDHAAAHPRHRRQRLGLRARHVGAEPGLGLPAAGGGRARRPRRLPAGDAGRQRPLPGGHAPVRPGRGHAGRDAGRGRADRPGARLHRLGHRARRRLARRAQPLAQPGAGRHHRLGLAGRVALGAAGAVAGRRLRLACRRAGLPGAGARHAAGRLDRRPRRSPAAAGRPGRAAAGFGQGRVGARLQKSRPSWS